MAGAEDNGYGEAAAPIQKGVEELEEFCEPPTKPQKISLQLALTNSLTKSELGDYNKLSAEEVYEKASTLKQLHLEWQQIGEIANLAPFENVEVLYLQYNRLERIEGLDFMPKLQFLALQGNKIQVIENLLELTALEFLDVSKNKIANFEVSELPKTLQVLNMRENVCTSAPDYKTRLLAHLPDLGYLDGTQLFEEDEVSETDKILEPLVVRGLSDEVQLEAGDKGLSAYYRKDGLQEGLSLSMAEQIASYSTEALGDADGFSRRVEEAVKRSENRRKNIEEQVLAMEAKINKTDKDSLAAAEKQLEAVKQAMAKTEALQAVSDAEKELKARSDLESSTTVES